MVYSIYRDSKGFLWIGTDKGVARYNGIKFEVFSSAHGLPDKEIFFFVEDGYGRIWLATFNGKLCYYQDGVFHNATNTPFLDVKAKFADTKFINKEKDSSVTICFSGSSCFINIKKETVKTVDLVNKYNTDYLTATDPSPGSSHMFSLSSVRFIGKNDRGGYTVESEVKHLEIDSNGHILTMRDRILRGTGITRERHISYDSLGIYGFDNPYYFKKGSNGIYVNKEVSNVTQVYYDSVNYFISMEKNLWIADSGSIFDKANISGVAQDNIGNYWVSTLDSGIFCFDKYFGKQEMVRGAYSGRVTFSCMRRGVPFFVNDKSTLFCIDGGKVKKLFSYDKNPFEAPVVHQDYAYCITDDLEFYFGAGYYLHHVKNIFSGKPRIQSLRHHERFGIKQLFVTGDYFYMHILNAVARFPLSLFDSGLFDYKGYRVSDTTLSRIYHAALAPDGKMWYAKMATTFKVVGDKYYVQKQFDNYSLRQIAFAGSYMICATQDNRLIVCNNYETKPIVDTVPDENCMWDKLLVIDSTHLLISTNNYYRIMTLQPSSGKARYSMTTIENPMIPLDAESICGDSKNCYFFKSGNIYTFDLQSLLIRSEPPRLYFNNMRTLRNSHAIGSLVTVPYEEAQNATISVTAISFRAKVIFYEYSISKSDKDVWQPMQGNVLNLVDPGFGAYTVKVRARTSSSDFCTPVSFVLHIATPWWATWWFISLSVSAVVAVTFLLVRFRLRGILRRKEREHDTKIKFMRSEYKALNALMNPHFIFNTLNNLQTLFNSQDIRRANKYMVIFSDLIRQNMHNVSKELISLRREMDLVTNYLMLEKLRFEKLNYTIYVSEDVDLSDIFVPPMLIQPLVENSIKHGILPLKSREGHIYITISEEDNQLHIEIKDNGVGISHSTAKAADSGIHESYGLSNIRERIRQLNTIQSNPLFFDMHEIRNETTGEHLWTTVIIKLTLS
jgi:two-component sensor histidine kinase